MVSCQEMSFPNLFVVVVKAVPSSADQHTWFMIHFKKVRKLIRFSIISCWYRRYLVAFGQSLTWWLDGDDASQHTFQESFFPRSRRCFERIWSIKFVQNGSERVSEYLQSFIIIFTQKSWKERAIIEKRFWNVCVFVSWNQIHVNPVARMPRSLQSTESSNRSGNSVS